MRPAARLGLITTSALAALLAVRPAGAQEPAPAGPGSGAAIYRTYCASCHGTDGRGDGPVADTLRYAPPDLRRIARRHRGEFPREEVARTIDGRDPLPGHGGGDMPVWGDAFKTRELGFDEAKVRERIERLVAHLESIQE